jgi:hypothetical protein
MCSKNFVVDVHLAPGEAYAQQLALVVQKGTREAALRFRVGFDLDGPLPMAARTGDGAGHPVAWSRDLVVTLTD